MREQRAIMRADRILDAVARARSPLTLSEIAAAITAPVSTTQDLIDDLCRCGYLRRTDRHYRLGARPHVLGVLAAHPGPPGGLDHAALQALSSDARVPIGLAALVGTELLYLDHAGPRAPRQLQRVADDHTPRPVLRTAAGRLLLAYAADADRERLLHLAADAVAAAAFTTELSTIRRERLARSDGLADPDIRAIALPVTEHGTVVAAAVLTARRYGPSGRSPALERAARRVAQRLMELPGDECYGRSHPDAPTGKPTVRGTTATDKRPRWQQA
ncbi:helix-turn-helix domain-containing protein [Nocardia sp. ET3-3]|uniref:Helix-turn-helix domain-containing protein n=1 Tax=Nocardia terrae TaxID=2675851 RepID=A0A7K1UST8_9NOCA|nr:helix-turn-helix domain-containing protein [Nocardia terrae]MVU77404.1 helix-turn-helix domain-containing protein [Nocardia terrae]